MSGNLKKLIACLTAFFSFIPLYASNLSIPPLPRITVSGNAGNLWFAETDALFPILNTPSGICFADVTGKYGNDNAWLLSFGLGSRNIVSDNALFGGYIFTDFNKTAYDKYISVLNPGVEGMSNAWDFHMNAYFPLGKKSRKLSTFSGNENIPNSVFFAEHRQYSSVYNYLENVGPGYDLEVGKTLFSFRRARLFSGIYYFSPQNSRQIMGIAAGFEAPLKASNFAIAIRDTYDNLNRNTFAVTLRYRFHIDSTKTQIADRLLDDIPRHIASLRQGNGIPTRNSIVNTGNRIVIRDNIWFFNPGVSYTEVQNYSYCTYETPCYGLGQLQIDAINRLSPNANFYLSSGVYNNDSSFNFHSGQNVFGRVPGFLQLADGVSRPLLTNSLIMNGNNNVHNLRIAGKSIAELEIGGAVEPFQIGILAASTSAGNNAIFDSEIDINSSDNNVIGISNDSNAPLTISNTTVISQLKNLPAGIAVGIGNLGSGPLDVLASTVMVDNSDLANNFSQAVGLINNEAGIVSIVNTYIGANLNHGGLLAGVLNNSSLVGGLGTVNISHSVINANGADVMSVGGVVNQANNMAGESASVNINQSLITVTSNNVGGGLASGVISNGNGVVNIHDTVIKGSGDSGIIRGLVVDDSNATMNYENTLIGLLISNTAVGVPTLNVGVLNDKGRNQCFENGALLPC